MNFEKYRKWPTISPLLECGVVVASNLTQEWLLPWWWDHYHRYNDFSVTFIDLGLSTKMKTWCLERGMLISLPVPDFFVQEKQEIAAPLVNNWEANYGTTFWESRSAWFKKPLACLQTPYQLSLWLDLDCEVRGHLSEIFAYGHCPEGIALVGDYDQARRIFAYNSGMMLFRFKTPLLPRWAEACVQSNHLFRGDDELLSHLIFTENHPICNLPARLNWSMQRGDLGKALIHHWHGEAGKNAIRHQQLPISVGYNL